MQLSILSMKLHLLTYKLNLELTLKLMKLGLVYQLNFRR